MRFSLCVICGNEEANIVRFLDSFAPAFDELSLCRAVGALKPDKTADLAAEWCASHGKEYIFTEHKNSAGAELWPHVDDFAAARNDSFAAASGDWLVWADCDDTLQQPEKLREVLAGSDVGDLVRFFYDVTGTGKRPLRERAIRRSLFSATGPNRWVFPVHENLLVARGTRISSHDAPVWVHAARPAALENRKRNREILSRTLAHSSANFFYVHQEWFCQGEHRPAAKFGVLALACPDLDPSFRYETNLNLSRITPDNDVAMRYALDAHAVFPWCREAMAMLCLLFIERNDPTRALHWSEKLNATAEPAEDRRPWTHEPKWYGWAALDMLARCQRFADKPDDAKQTQARLHGEPGPLFSLIHATRGRAAKAADTRNTWLNLAAHPERIQHIMCCDADDKKTLHLAKQYEHTVSDKQSCVAAWNQGAAYSSGQILIQLSDDWVPFPGWDDVILRELERAGKTPDDEWVLAISDGHRKDDLLCMAILSRARYLKQRDVGNIIIDPNGKGFGWSEVSHMFSPEYESMYSDNEFSHRAFRDGVVIDARQRITFQHMHPAFGRAPMDATYEHNNKRERYKRGLETFKRRNPDVK